MSENGKSLYVIESSRKLEGPVFYLGPRSGNYYYLIFAKSTIEISGTLGKFNSSTKVLGYKKLELEKVVAIRGLSREITLQDLLINIALSP